MEHPAPGQAIHDGAVDAKTDDATCELIHHYEDPVSSQRCRFVSE
jgi:hypothetical protein